MDRICTTLAENGYSVTLVGRKLKTSVPLQSKKYQQRRIRCFFNKGKLFYAEFNMRLFYWLLFKKMDAVCAIDLDTIAPCYSISVFKRIPRIYDAHEFFTELKEVRERKKVKKMWERLEKTLVPRFKWGYTVSESIAAEFAKRYNVKYATIRNLPVLREKPEQEREDFILYQGAVNEARGFEHLVPAMQWIDRKLVICGDGNFMPQLKKLISEHGMESKIELKGMFSPEALREISSRAKIGVALAERDGLNQYLALPNKFLDYIHAGLPQVTMNYPEYQKINSEFEVAVLIDELDPQQIASAMNNLLDDTVLYQRLQENCMKARKTLNWQEEEKKLLAFYESVFKA